MPSTSITDYQVLMGGSLTLEFDISNPSFPRASDDTLSWPDDLHVSTGARRPILMFNT